MSYLSFDSSNSSPTGSQGKVNGNLRSEYSRWLMNNHGEKYRKTVNQQRKRAQSDKFLSEVSSCDHEKPTSKPLVGVIGGGFAGMYAGLILQSLGIEFEIFESSDRVGGRIKTWYSTDYSEKNSDSAALYGEVGGMRLPQYSEDMLPVQQLALCVNSVLERNGMKDKSVYWRKFYYNSPEQRMRFNNMDSPITAKESSLNSLNFGAEQGGDLAPVWVTPKESQSESPYLPINKVLDQVNQPFLDAINNSFSEGFALMEQFDQHSMWDYLTTVFTLGDLGEYYDPAMGPKSDFLPWSVANYLETTNVGTGMYSVSFVEMVIAVYDWGGSKNPYKPDDDSVYMLTVDKGMQHFPDACHAVLNLNDAVTEEEGQAAQVEVGMLPSNGKYSYNPPNLTSDARPEGWSANSSKSVVGKAAETKERVFLNKKVTSIKHDPNLFDKHGGLKVKIKDTRFAEAEEEKNYPFVISTLPNGAYINGELKDNLLSDLSFSKAQAIRDINYMSAFKAFITFKKNFWAEDERQSGVGAASTDRPNRQIVYPSYGYDAKGGVLQVYCWAEDAKRLGALSDEERVNECLKGISYLYPEADVYGSFAGYDDGTTTKTWFWDTHAGGGAFALFGPDQFKNLYATLLTPEFDGCLNFAGEACSVHHGWIVGALDSAYNSVFNILKQIGAHDKIAQMQKTWGHFSPPDVAEDEATENIMEYTYTMNDADRKASSVVPGAESSIYGSSDYIFNGDIPAFIKDFGKVPQSMKKTAQDTKVLNMLNDQWTENVALRDKIQGQKSLSGIIPEAETAVELLENLYYGDNFQTIPAPKFWLKDDAEFARQQLAGFMPNLLKRTSPDELKELISRAGVPNVEELGSLEEISYVADYRHYLEACTVIPEGYYLAQPLVFFKIDKNNQLMPIGIQLELNKQIFTPVMANAENAWLLAKMQVNCAGQTLHDVGFHQLYTHQICAMVSIALFSEEVFNDPASSYGFQEHPVFKLLRPHVVKTVEFQQTIYNKDYKPDLPNFPETREVNGSPGVYNLGFIYDLIFSCGRIGSYQLQDKMYNLDGEFNFLNLAVTKDAEKRGVENTPFSYPYVHDATLWYKAISKFVGELVDNIYENDKAVQADIELQNFFNKLIPAFNHCEGEDCQAARFPSEVKDKSKLHEVLTMFVWQFSVQHTVINDGAYNQAAFVPNASTLMMPLPKASSDQWTPQDVLNCLPSQKTLYPEIGGMIFMDIQINASVTGQGPYPETIFGRGVFETSLDYLQDTYNFVDPELSQTVVNFYQEIRKVGDAISNRQSRDTAEFLKNTPNSIGVPETVVFDLLNPGRVMNTIQT